MGPHSTLTVFDSLFGLDMCRGGTVDTLVGECKIWSYQVGSEEVGQRGDLWIQ